MQILETIRDGKWERLNISQEEIEQRKEKYFAELEKLYPNLKSISNEEYQEIRGLYNTKKGIFINETLEKTLKYVLYPVVSAYSRYSIKGFEFEDAIESAVLIYNDKLLNSEFYLPETRDKFVVYINRLIVHLLKRKDQAIRRRNVHLNFEWENIHGIIEEDDLSLIDEKIHKEDVIKIILKIYNTLSETDKQVFIKLFKEGKQEFIVAKELLISRETVNQSKKRIRKLILRKLAYELRYIPKEYEFGGINPYED